MHNLKLNHHKHTVTMSRILWIFVSLIALLHLKANAQNERKFIRSGNELFENEEYESSEVKYRKALSKKTESFEAAFNLGDALYKQKKYDEALKQFQNLALQEKDPERLGHLFHNMGNTLLESKKIDESIEAYKQSLRYNPNSKETKYNLEYARQMKKQQEQQQKQQDNKQNKDQKDKEQNKDQQNQKDQNQKQQQQQQDKHKNEQGGEQEKQEQKISREAAERLLEALEKDQKEVQEKVQKAKAKAMKSKKSKIQKDW